MGYRVNDLSFSYGPLPVLNGLSAEFADSSVTALLGPSGCGKTSFLNLLSGLVEPDSGSIEGFREASVSYCFQEPRLLPWLTAKENIRFALSRFEDGAAMETRAVAFLGLAGLADFSDYYPNKLSGGMRRRLALARAFAYPSSLLLLDEAFTAVDLRMRLELMDLFSKLWEEERRTTILVTHEIQDALYLADRVLLLSERPAQVLEDIPLHIPRKNRSFGAGEALKLGAKLYEAVLGPEGRTEARAATRSAGE